MEPHELKEALLNNAFASAAIDRYDWDPARGFEKNKQTAEAVYTYYGQLFLSHPYLKWAGMANLIGPAFYAGFRDIAILPDGMHRVLHWMFGQALRNLARREVVPLGFYEMTFLRMQKKIFEDQATLHEAYIAGGVPRIEDLYRARIIDVATLKAWQQIDAGRNGNPALVDCGNRTLLFREQFDIIDRFYLQMIQWHWPMGPLFTYLLTLVGAPSVPGADSFPQRYPRTFVARLPRGAISLRTPLTRGNIAVFANRWRLIDDDTLPKYLEFARDHTDQMLEEVGSPVSLRASHYRLLRRTDRLVAAALTRWKLAVSADRAHPRAFATRQARPVPLTHTGDLIIDLTSQPTRGSVGFAEGAASRVWMDPKQRIFDITVALPGGSVYRAQVEIAVMLSSVRDGDPNRLAVRLPSADAPVTEQMMTRYATKWGFPADAVGRWGTGAKRIALSDRHYSTHVFTPDDVGFVHLEFQISHHVREGICVVTALFSWEGHTA